jgi:hypothetical protein
VRKRVLEVTRQKQNARREQHPSCRRARQILGNVRELHYCNNFALFFNAKKALKSEQNMELFQQQQQ